MVVIDYAESLEELAVFFKNQDIFTIATRGVATVTEEFNGTGAQTDFTLGNTPVRNVRTITVDGGSALIFGTDFSVNYVTAVVTFVVAPASGTNNVDITYDHGSSDKVYTDKPRLDLTIASYPRLSVELLADRAESFALGGGVKLTDGLFIVEIREKNPRTLDGYINSIRQAIIDNEKNFFYFPFVTYTGVGPKGIVANAAQEVFSRQVNFEGKFRLET